MRIIGSIYVRRMRLNGSKKICKDSGEMKLTDILEMNRANTTISENALEDDITLE